MARKKNSGDTSQALTPSQKRQHTQWGTQFLVAAELERRGYTVSFTMGHNTPVADLMVATAAGEQFSVDVKGQSGRSSWNLRAKKDWKNLYYVLVYFPPHKPSKKRDADRFFILTQAEANELVRVYRNNHPGDTGKAPGFAFKDPQPFEDSWRALPE